MTHVLFVCKGNICRSPFAAAVLSTEISARPLINVEVRSRGTTVYHVGRGADPLAIKVANEFGYEIANHAATQLTEQDVRWADLILALDLGNRAQLMESFPWVAASHRVRMLGQFLKPPQSEIPDPYKKSEDEFRESLRLVQDATREVANLLISGSATIPT